jgi:hypothetical protein
VTYLPIAFRKKTERNRERGRRLMAGVGKEPVYAGDVVRPGAVVVHGTCGDTWYALPGYKKKLEPCDCGWAPQLGQHYRPAVRIKPALVLRLRHRPPQRVK